MQSKSRIKLSCESLEDRKLLTVATSLELDGFGLSLPSRSAGELGPTGEVQISQRGPGRLELYRETPDADSGTFHVDVELELQANPISEFARSQGDLTGDGQVQFDDFLIFSDQFGQPASPPSSGADFDGSGTVDFPDFLIFSNNFGNDYGTWTARLSADAEWSAAPETGALRVGANDLNLEFVNPNVNGHIWVHIWHIWFIDPWRFNEVFDADLQKQFDFDVFTDDSRTPEREFVEINWEPFADDAISNHVISDPVGGFQGEVVGPQAVDFAIDGFVLQLPPASAGELGATGEVRMRQTGEGTARIHRDSVNDESGTFSLDIPLALEADLLDDEWTGDLSVQIPWEVEPETGFILTGTTDLNLEFMNPQFPGHIWVHIWHFWIRDPWVINEVFEAELGKDINFEVFIEDAQTPADEFVEINWEPLGPGISQHIQPGQVGEMFGQVSEGDPQPRPAQPVEFEINDFNFTLPSAVTNEGLETGEVLLRQRGAGRASIQRGTNDKMNGIFSLDVPLSLSSELSDSDFTADLSLRMPWEADPETGVLRVGLENIDLEFENAQFPGHIWVHIWHLWFIDPWRFTEVFEAEFGHQFDFEVFTDDSRTDEVEFAEINWEPLGAGISRHLDKERAGGFLAEVSSGRPVEDQFVDLAIDDFEILLPGALAGELGETGNVSLQQNGDARAQLRRAGNADRGTMSVEIPLLLDAELLEGTEWTSNLRLDVPWEADPETGFILAGASDVNLEFVNPQFPGHIWVHLWHIWFRDPWRFNEVFEVDPGKLIDFEVLTDDSRTEPVEFVEINWEPFGNGISQHFAEDQVGEFVGQVPETDVQQDFFNNFDGIQPLEIANNAIGIVPREGVSFDELGGFLESFNLRPSNTTAPGIGVFETREAMSRPAMNRLAAEIAEVGDSLIASAGITARPPSAEVPMIITEEFIVHFGANVSQQQIDEFNAAHGVEIVSKDPFVENQFILQSRDSLFDALDLSNRYHESELTNFSHPNFVVPIELRQVIPTDTYFGNQWQHNNTMQAGGTIDADIDSDTAWDFTQGANRTVIAVLDDGFDLTHPDLNFVSGFDFAGSDNDPSPGFGDNHGTAVAGMAAAQNNGVGVVGSCPDCAIMPVRIALSTSAQAVSGQASAFDFARNNGAEIISNSWGYPIGFPVPTVVATAINNAANNGRGGLGSVVLFAMNNPNVNDCGSTPDISALNNVIAVSRASNFDRFDLSGFGNCMDVLAPSAGLTTVSAGRGTLWVPSTDRQGTSGYNNSSTSAFCPTTEPSSPSSARDYTMCFNGTSAAAPLTAGVAGLILTADPSLTRIQVQRLLQDTSDKVEDSLGAYDTDTGFSSPASGQATHGYGRINAREAVEIVAPTSQGGKGGVDIMLRDNRLDWGNTEQPSNTLFEQTRGHIAHWRSEDIKVDAFPYAFGTTSITAAQFDSFADEPPSADPAAMPNRVYVRVRNRGPEAASNVNVKLHWTQFGTGLPALPADFWTQFPNDSSDTSQWRPLNCIGSTSTVCNISNLGYSGASVATTGTDAAQVVTFDFPPPAFDASLPNHFCLTAMVETANDPISPNSKSSFVIDHITPRDNNVTHRNYHNLPRSSRSAGRSFFVRNPFERAIETRLTLDAPEGWRVQLDEFGFDEFFVLEPRSEVLVTIEESTRPNQGEGEFTISQSYIDFEQDKEVVLGGLTFGFFEPADGQTPDVRELPDLTIAGFDVTAQEAVVGSDFGEQIVLFIKNDGADMTNSPSFPIGVYLSQDEQITTSDRLLIGGREFVTPLKSGEQREVGVDPISIPRDIAPGSYFLGVLLDEFDAINESDETNNTAFAKVEILPAFIPPIVLPPVIPPVVVEPPILGPIDPPVLVPIDPPVLVPIDPPILVPIDPPLLPEVPFPDVLLPVDLVPEFAQRSLTEDATDELLAALV